MTNRDFDEWLSQFKPSIATFDYYVDFEKVHRNVGEIKVELNILNSLIGSRNIKNNFVDLVKRYPDVLKVIPILLAVRQYEIYCKDETGEYFYKFNFDIHNGGEYRPNSHKFKTYEQYVYFMDKTGLFDLLANHLINNLVDYVTGVETGLDTHARKSRGGDLMEDLVESFIQEQGFIKGKTYFKEMTTAKISKKWNIDLSALTNAGKVAKRFDFVIKTDTMIYGIETNFYNVGGSKLNETARSYKMLAQEASTIDGFTFVWFTDGKSWETAKENLRETFDVLETLFNIKEMEDGIMKELFV